MTFTGRLLKNLSISRKLLLASVIPVIVLILLSVVTYRSVHVFAEDEEQLGNIYLVQRKAAEYIRLAVDLETGFRGYVITRQNPYLRPYLMAHDRILPVGDYLIERVNDRETQRLIMVQVQDLVKQMMMEKEQLIKAVQAGDSLEAIEYIEKGRGRSIMASIRQQMHEFDRMEQDLLNAALARMGRDRTFMTNVILGGGILSLVLLVLALHVIARSITTPLVTLAKTVGAARGGRIPELPILDRNDEIGDLARVMRVMTTQIKEHIARIEKSEAELLALNLDLQASESKYRSIVDHAPFGIFTTQGMRLVFSNRYNHILAGLDPERETDLESLRKAIHPEDRARVLEEFAEAVKEDRPYETVYRFAHTDGTVKKVLTVRIPIHDSDGQTVMYQCFNVDITVLDQMQARLARVERLASLGQMAAGIAHELRNPLVGIGTTASLMLDEADRADPRRQELEIILRETKRLDRIVNQIIDYVRPRHLVPVVFSLEELIQETLIGLKAALETKRLTVEAHLHPQLSPLHADRDQLKQVLLNVIQNAVEASLDDQTIKIMAFDLTRESTRGVAVHVSDQGRGIAPADVAHVFEPFFTTGKRHGTGLGLSICRNIIDAHQGDIDIASQLGEGTTVKIWLPLRQATTVLGE